MNRNTFLYEDIRLFILSECLNFYKPEGDTKTNEGIEGPTLEHFDIGL